MAILLQIIYLALRTLLTVDSLTLSLTALPAETDGESNPSADAEWSLAVTPAPREAKPGRLAWAAAVVSLRLNLRRNLKPL